MKRIPFFLTFLVFFSANAQERGCWNSINRNLEKSIHQKIGPGSDIFEKWMEKEVSKIESTQNFDTVYTIPVVVHIIHNGEPIGTGANLLDERVYSQIRILNEDYRKKVNTPGWNTNPVGADARIEFKLATRTPDNQPTNGIIRKNGGKAFWQTPDGLLDSVSYWPAKDYLNIWVCNLSGSNIGYAQFPLPGDSVQYNNSQYMDTGIEGVVVDFQVFGDVPPSPNQPFASYSKGRTLTHELGHFFSLIHIWGDVSGCGDDMCPDTPTQNGWTQNCPTTKSTCGFNDMFQNYMDYTNDVCMNIFTRNQVSRMRVCIRNSPNRSSLISSLGATPLSILPNRVYKPIEVYPNPAKESIQIQVPAQIAIQKVYAVAMDGKHFDLSFSQEASQITSGLRDLTPGVYQILLMSNSASFSSRLVVE